MGAWHIPEGVDEAQSADHDSCIADCNAPCARTAFWVGDLITGLCLLFIRDAIVAGIWTIGWRCRCWHWGFHRLRRGGVRLLVVGGHVESVVLLKRSSMCQRWIHGEEISIKLSNVLFGQAVFRVEEGRRGRCIRYIDQSGPKPALLGVCHVHLTLASQEVRCAVHGSMSQIGGSAVVTSSTRELKVIHS